MEKSSMCLLIILLGFQIHLGESTISLNFCAGKTGLYRDPQNCRNYFSCYMFNGMKFTCQNDYHFNAVEKTCQTPEKAGCIINEDNADANRICKDIKNVKGCVGMVKCDICLDTIEVTSCETRDHWIRRGCPPNQLYSAINNTLSRTTFVTWGQDEHLAHRLIYGERNMEVKLRIPEMIWKPLKKDSETELKFTLTNMLAENGHKNLVKITNNNCNKANSLKSKDTCNLSKEDFITQTDVTFDINLRAQKCPWKTFEEFTLNFFLLLQKDEMQTMQTMKKEEHEMKIYIFCKENFD